MDGQVQITCQLIQKRDGGAGAEAGEEQPQGQKDNDVYLAGTE